MKKTMLVATFLAVGAGSAGVSALDNNTMLGSDTLKLFTLNVISNAVCPGAVGITYTGGGSDGGEDQMVAGSVTQSVAPMSKFITNKVCPTGKTATAEGIAFATDGINIVTSAIHKAACQITKSATDCTASPTGASGSGLKSTGSVACAAGEPGCVSGTYTFGVATNVAGWQDVLRTIYQGLPQTAGKLSGSPANALGTVVRNCNSVTRQNLVNNWGNLFENGCEASGGSCTQLTHAFRRDLHSGTTDVFRELINSKLYPFCSARFGGDTTPTEYPTTLADGSPIFDDAYQDFDPIRRVCDGGGGGGADLPPLSGGTQPDFPNFTAEQVCSPAGTLGLVLTIAPPGVTGATVADLYPTKPCQKGKLAFAVAPNVPGTNLSTLCPNGDVTLGQNKTKYVATTGAITNSSHNCLIPVASDGDARCINGRNNFINPADPPFGQIPVASRDGRVYNLHLRKQNGSYQADVQLDPDGAQVVGNVSRIHTTRTELAAGPSCPGTGGDKRCCSDLDATSEIGCLVQADPCAFGFAGGEAKNFVLQTTNTTPEAAYAADINGVQGAGECIQNAKYPLSRKVYINTYNGFETVTGQELALAKCFVTAGDSPSQLASFGLFQLKTGASGTAGAVCQEISNAICSSVPVNTSTGACANNPTGIPTVLTH